jgi:hypothetical protein
MVWEWLARFLPGSCLNGPNDGCLWSTAAIVSEFGSGGTRARKPMRDMVAAPKAAQLARLLQSSPDPEDQRETTTVVPTVTRW